MLEGLLVKSASDQHSSATRVETRSRVLGRRENLRDLVMRLEYIAVSVTAGMETLPPGHRLGDSDVFLY